MKTRNKIENKKKIYKTSANNVIIERDKKILSFKPLVAVSAIIIVTIAFYFPVIICKGFLWNDFLEQNFVYRLFSAVWLKKGIIPFWNPYVFSGMPFFADIQAALLYPVNLILTFFASKEWLSPILVEYQIILHIAMAGSFMYLLAKEFGATKSGSFLAGITFMLCGFFTTHIFHSNLIYAASWFPLVVFLFKRTIDRISLLYMSSTAIVLAIVFFCGYPQLMVHMYYWLGAYYIYGLITRIVNKTKTALEIKRFLLFLSLVILSVGISAVQLLPTQELAQNSVRPKLEFKESCEGSFRFYRFITLLVPNYFGKPQKGIYWGISEKDVNAGAHYYWETAIYTGTVTLFLAFIACFFIRTPIVIFLLIMSIISFLLSMGDSFFLYKLFFNYLPGFNAFRIPARFAFLFSFSVALLGALGLSWFQKECLKVSNNKKQIIEKIFLILAVFAVIWGLAYLFGAFKNGISDFIIKSERFGNNFREISFYVDKHIYPDVVKNVWIFVMFFICLSVLFIARLRAKISAKIFTLFLVSITLLDFFVFGYGYAAGNIDPRLIYYKTELVKQLQKLGESEFFRINSRSSNPSTDDLGGPYMIFRKNQGSVHNLFLMEGYNPLRLKRQLVNRKDKTLDILNVKYKIYVDENNQRMSLIPHPTYFPRCRMVYNYIVEKNENDILNKMYSPEFDHARTIILEEKPQIDIQPSNDSIENNCKIISYSLNKIDIEVKTQKNGLLVLSEIYFPSWKAMVDNKPVPLYRADYALRAIPVSEGYHKVSCFFSKEVFMKGLYISLTCFFVTVILGILHFLILKRKLI